MDFMFAVDTAHQFVMASLHYVHEMKAYRTDHVCLSVRLYACIFRLKNLKEDFDEIWQEPIGGYSKLVHYNFLQSVIPTWRTLGL
jgi:hypothetical protein